MCAGYMPLYLNLVQKNTILNYKQIHFHLSNLTCGIIITYRASIELFWTELSVGGNTNEASKLI